MGDKSSVKFNRLPLTLHTISVDELYKHRRDTAGNVEFDKMWIFKNTSKSLIEPD